MIAVSLTVRFLRLRRAAQLWVNASRIHCQQRDKPNPLKAGRQPCRVLFQIDIRQSSALPASHDPRLQNVRRERTC